MNISSLDLIWFAKIDNWFSIFYTINIFVCISFGLHFFASQFVLKIKATGSKVWYIRTFWRKGTLRFGLNKQTNQLRKKWMYWNSYCNFWALFRFISSFLWHFKGNRKSQHKNGVIWLSFALKRMPSKYVNRMLHKFTFWTSIKEQYKQCQTAYRFAWKWK